MPDIATRVQQLEESMDWRAELKKDHSALAAIIFSGDSMAQRNLHGFLDSLKVSKMQDFYSDEIDGLLDFVAGCIDTGVNFDFCMKHEEAVRKEFKAWRQDRAIEIELEKEER